MHREVVLLLVLSVLAAVMFLVTRGAAASMRDQQTRDAATWHDRGREATARGDAATATDALRRAVVLQPDSWPYARALAEALVADGRPDASRQLLLRWRGLRPDDAEVNTHLARLEAGAGNLDAAVGFFESALHGSWPAGGVEARLALRRELIQLLISAGRTGPALSHVLTLAANVPDDARAQSDVARLFMAAGDPARALARYQRSLRLAPGDREARAGAGAAAFALDDVATALGYVRGLTDAPSRRIAGIAQAVAALDPLWPRLSSTEQLRRLIAGVEAANRQLEGCRARRPAPTPLSERTAAALTGTMTTFLRQLEGARRRDAPELIHRGLELTASAIDAVAVRCPPLDEQAEALRHIARRHADTP